MSTGKSYVERRFVLFFDRIDEHAIDDLFMETVSADIWEFGTADDSAHITCVEPRDAVMLRVLFGERLISLKEDMRFLLREHADGEVDNAVSSYAMRPTITRMKRMALIFSSDEALEEFLNVADGHEKNFKGVFPVLVRVIQTR